VRAISGGVPGAQLLVLKEASHLAYVEQPQAFGEAVRGFMAAL
jgi:3-oxoadipate enol-lactonase